MLETILFFAAIGAALLAAFSFFTAIVEGNPAILIVTLIFIAIAIPSWIYKEDLRSERMSEAQRIAAEYEAQLLQKSQDSIVFFDNDASWSGPSRFIEEIVAHVERLEENWQIKSIKETAENGITAIIWHKP
jgi:c-di-AMP phosphodiesterase-like protein